MIRGKKLSISIFMLCLAVALALFPARSFAADPAPGDFNLQVTPSPLVTSVKPGVSSQVELKIHNQGSTAEKLKIETRPFTYDSSSGKINLEDTSVSPVGSWVTFTAPKFTVDTGQWYTQQITFNVPKDAGFSYSFAIVISRQTDQKATGSERVIKGSLAIFALVNVDRPGATSTMKVASFTSVKKLYEYLPATFNVRFQNTGNTILQPLGNIFVGRSATAKNPLATLTVNDKRGYILPGTSRVISTSWNDGFAVYKTDSSAPGGSAAKHLSVDWSKLSHFRIGHYSAHLVAVYSDGHHDIPIEGTVSFWVIPWRAILLFIAVVVLLWLLARWRGKRRTDKAVKRALAAQAAAHEANKKAAEKKTEEQQS